MDSSKARVHSQKAQLEVTRAQVNQSKAVLVHTKDILSKTTYVSPINGIVSYLPVKVGEYVVLGMQNATGSFLMTLSDMSVVTAEVKVDETDIVNIKIGQDADVTIDAVPGKSVQGKSNRDRLAGGAAQFRTGDNADNDEQPGSQRLQGGGNAGEPPGELAARACPHTAKIKTAEKKDVVAIPIQALAVRSRKDLEEAAKSAKKGGNVTLAAPPDAGGRRSEEGRSAGRFRG